MLSVKQVKRFSVPLSFHLINQLNLKSLTEIYFFILQVNAMFSTFISLNNIHLEHPFGPSPYSLVYYL